MEKAKPKKAAAILSMFILCYALWLAFTWSLDPLELILGAVVSLVVASLTARMFIHESPFYLYNPVRLALFFYYGLVVLMSEIVKANWDVARRAFRRDMGLNPGIIRIPVRVNSEYGLAFLANGITLTPGTITMEAATCEGKDYFYVHWIDVATTDREEAGRLIKERMERWIRRI